MDWLSFVGSIIGGIIGGLFTFLGVKATIKYEKKRENSEVLRDAIDKKPRLEIDYAWGAASPQNETSLDCDALVLPIKEFILNENHPRFIYDNEALNYNNLSSIQYELKNTGKTEVFEVILSHKLPQFFSLVNLSSRDFYINEKFLNYDVESNKKYIKPGESIIIRIYYLTNQFEKCKSCLANLDIWLLDVNGRYWRQSLDAINHQIQISRHATRQDFMNSTDTNKAIECFKNPKSW